MLQAKVNRVISSLALLSDTEWCLSYLFNLKKNQKSVFSSSKIISHDGKLINIVLDWYSKYVMFDEIYKI